MAQKKRDPAAGEQTVDIVALDRREVAVAIIWETPLIFNRMSEKVRQGLLLPSGRKTDADKLANLKHDPVAEYRASPYRLKSDKEPTLLGIPAGAFKKAIGRAAVRMPGATMAEIGQMTRVITTNEENLVPVFGIPYLKMDVARSHDISRTPDVRTRACLKQWAAILRISFMHPNLNQKTIVNLLSAAGQIVGVGDWRQEKGSGEFGCWRLTDSDDADLRLILRDGGRIAQIDALETPVPYDSESADLLSWYTTELERRRGKEPEPAKKKSK